MESKQPKHMKTPFKKRDMSSLFYFLDRRCNIYVSDFGDFVLFRQLLRLFILVHLS